MSIIEGILDLQKYDFTDTSFDLLMQKRIHRVLMICRLRLKRIKALGAKVENRAGLHGFVSCGT